MDSPPTPALPTNLPAGHPLRPSLWKRATQKLHQVLPLRKTSWLRLVTPRFLHPEFTWPQFRLWDVPVSSRIQRVEACPQRRISRRMLRLVGRVHDGLFRFSEYYCAWYGVGYQDYVRPLPFGLVLKHSEGTSLDEVDAMRAVRAAGVPAPRVVSYGTHPERPLAPVSILMTRLPGEELGVVYGDMSVQEQSNIREELRYILDTMRWWPNPNMGWRPRICSISGGAIWSRRVPRNRIEPCDTEYEFTEHLLSTEARWSSVTTEAYLERLGQATRMLSMTHHVVFTHGDFAPHHVMVHKGRVSGLIDWKSAGWYPEYWEFTTPLRWSGCWPAWEQLVLGLGGSKYEAELESERAIKNLTAASWMGW